MPRGVAQRIGQYGGIILGVAGAEGPEALVGILPVESQEGIC